MKRLYIIALLALIFDFSFSQTRVNTLSASLTGNNRLSVVKGSIVIPTWHEKNFWSLYDKYFNNAVSLSSVSYRSLRSFAIARNAESNEVFESGRSMISNREQWLKMLEKYYNEVASDFNGVIALQFLQAESLLDMMECAHIYEQTEWKDFRFHESTINAEIKAAKHNTIRRAVSLTPDKAEAFWRIYFSYEEECNALLGDNYSIVSLYAVEPSDFTPGLSKRLGYDFLHMLQRENRLKEKYFLKMSEAVGPVLASRFLAWEDYYSLTSKLYAWAED